MEGTQTTHEHGHETPADFARTRAIKTDKSFADINERLSSLSSRVEDIAGMTGEIGSHTCPMDPKVLAEKNVITRGVHWLDQKIVSALPYLRVAAATAVVVGGATVGVNEVLKRTGKKPDAKAMPVGEPISVG